MSGPAHGAATRAARGGRWVALPALAASAAAELLATPWLPEAALADCARVRRAAALRLPVLVIAPPGAPRLRLARALHAAAGCADVLRTATTPVPRFGALPPGAAVVVDCDALPAAAVPALEAVIDDGDAWVIAVAASRAALPASLAAALGVVLLEVPPLAARAGDVPALADAVLARFAARAGAAPLPLADEARAMLAAHEWPGDVAELEAVLARALLHADEGPLAPDHLVFARAAVTASPAPPAPVATPTSVPAPAPTPAPQAAALELLVAEMAHELKNPLVTIKTFADHLPQLLEDRTLRDRFATLADEAIERMDALLDNVLDFARLGPPRAEPVAVGPLLARLVAEVQPELDRRDVSVRRNAAVDDARCAGDPEHITYALRNLLAGVAREVAPRDEVVVDATANGVVRLGFATGAAAATRLRQLATPDAAHDLGDPTLLPLPFRLARAALERSGGSLGVVPDAGGRTALEVRLPAVPTS